MPCECGCPEAEERVTFFRVRFTSSYVLLMLVLGMEIWLSARTSVFNHCPSSAPIFSFINSYFLNPCMLLLIWYGLWSIIEYLYSQ